MSHLKQRWDLLLFLISLLFLLQWAFPSVAADDPFTSPELKEHISIEDLKFQLQQMEKKERTLGQKIAGVEEQIKVQEINRLSQKEHVDQILIAYYTGERDDLLQLLFEADGLKEAIAIWEYMQVVFEYDMHQLLRYQDTYDKLCESKQELQYFQQDLQAIHDHYQAQERLLAELASIYADKWEHWTTTKRKEVLMEQLLIHWNASGIQSFHQFFQALASSMEQLPEMFNESNLKHSLLNYELTITDQELNDFLKKKNPLFQNLSFRFQAGELIVHGTYQESVLSMRGYYHLDSPSELQFTINEMIYDGYYLPSTSIEEMAQFYDLGFYPQQIVPNVEITQFSMEQGKMVVQLSLSLKK
ncbi:coiled-coil domain-containing protein [Rubeoparvulum massiliense]|uniref:hypothetical protein n=1 Tax=Rubeoparvulum massiliense TaxID=1631346 RepID=UPI00065E4DF1|nr:hypothetical protein [Rubeoparvulum massiliense]